MKKNFGVLAAFALLVIAACLFTLPTTAQAAEESDLTFTLNETGDGYIVSNCDESASGELVIPATYNGLPVTAIGDSAFSFRSRLTSIAIPDSVTTIGHSAFYGCYNLATITIPDSVTTIDDLAFTGCSSLTSVHISDLVAWCGIEFSDSTSNPFNYAETLYLNDQLVTNLVISEGVTAISDYAFYNCSNLTGIVIPDSVTSIGDYAFSDCTGLTGITIPDNVTTIGDYAFEYCSNLTGIIIPDSVIKMGENPFYNCPKITSFQVENGNPVYHSAGNTIIETGSGTLVVGCLDSKIPSDGSVTRIGDRAFAGCTGLTDIIIPDSVTSIGDGVFVDCTGLTDIIIPDSVTSIGEGAFSRCTGLTNITLSNSITVIEGSTFNGCSGLTSIIIPDSVTVIQDLIMTGGDEGVAELAPAFAGCSGLTSIVFGEGITEIASWTLRECPNLTTIAMRNSVTTIGSGATSKCAKLQIVIYCGTQAQCDTIEVYGNNDPLLTATLQFHNYENGVCTLCKEGACESQGHSWADATCDTPKTCTICQVTEGNVLGHNMQETAGAVATTCETAGKTAVLTCANGCGKTEGGEVVPALGHDMKETAAAVAPTCEAAGKTAVLTCAVCGKTEGGEVIPALGHDMKETAPAVVPTCEAAGKTAVFTCANGCGKTEGGEEIPAKGHTFENDICTVCGQGKFVAGDGNGDGKVNLRDAIMVLQAVNGKDIAIDRSAADVNGDGKVNLQDAIRILKRANGNKDPFPAEK